MIQVLSGQSIPLASLSKARTQWDQRRVAILGAARQGLALAHYLLEKGARVILNDARPEDQLGVALDSFSDLGAQRKENLEMAVRQPSF